LNFRAGIRCLKGVIELPQRKAGIIDLRKTRRRRLHNLDIKTDLKKTVKKFLVSVNEDKKDEARQQLQTVYKKLDKAAKRNVIHPNTASRRKSRFGKLAAGIGDKASKKSK